MASPSIRLCLLLHNHQPVGNFDYVVEDAYQDSYKPFLDLLVTYPTIPVSLHTSGPLLLWLEQHHPEYLDRIKKLVAEGRLEIIGGALYEPILTMIPPRDRQEQIRRFGKRLEERFDTTVRGIWVPERVWEPGLVKDLAESGVQYTVLDDFHFRCAGLAHDGLHGDYVTEDQGHTLRVFPGSEQLRYTIPFKAPEQTIQYLQEIAVARPGSTVVFADDGEKFGSWPDTHEHVYDNGWLRSFFDALVANQDWLQCTRLRDAVKQSVPRGKIYLPAASYREMTEWSLPVDRQLEYESLARELESDWRWPKIRKFMRGGFWRDFKVKYPETSEMYARMMYVSRRIADVEHLSNIDGSLLDKARDHLYRGQCNCAYWHGAFGGVYLPHLRLAVYQHLILADNLIDQATRQLDPSIEAADFDFDLSAEIRMANPHLICWFQPARGGHLYGLDIRSIAHNLLATMDRRPEAYHEKVRKGATAGGDSSASIHDRVIFKQEGLDRMLIYDDSPCKSLVDHFFDQDATREEMIAGKAAELGDFACGVYQSTVRRSPQRNQVLMTRDGQVAGHSIKITKGVTLGSDDSTLEIAYLLEGLPQDEELRFGIEFNFAGLPVDQDDRFFTGRNGESLGQLGEQLELNGCQEISLSDQWLDLRIRLGWDRPGTVWTWPISTVNGSESGFELVHQSVRVQPNWLIRGDDNGRWVIKLEMSVRAGQTSSVEEISAEGARARS
ncbi:MAG: alpha-amylase/4-alpha-glucanotransferase domain-containing protein [Pirellulaceae bacterium]